jgi:hypothetical protein
LKDSSRLEKSDLDDSWLQLKGLTQCHWSHDRQGVVQCLPSAPWRSRLQTQHASSGLRGCQRTPHLACPGGLRAFAPAVKTHVWGQGQQATSAGKVGSNLKACKVQVVQAYSYLNRSLSARSPRVCRSITDLVSVLVHSEGKSKVKPL